MRRRFVLAGSQGKAGGAATARTPTYRTWSSMVRRCYDDRVKEYPDYGGRGIAVCDRWRGSFAAFLEDMGERVEGTTIDRIDGARDYEPGNCRWATAKEQARNRRSSHRITAFGETLTIAGWSEKTGLRRDTILRRLTVGWTAEDAVSRPRDMRRLRRAS